MNKIVIALITDSNYVMQISVVIASIISTAKYSEYDIFILASNLEENQAKTLKSMSTDNVTINIINVGNKYKSIPNTQKWSNTVFIKFDIPFLIPNYDKILYLDGDIIVNNDLQDLYTINLEDYYAAVVPDIAQVLRKDFLKELNNYFCAGMILFNAKKMREKFSFELLLQYYIDNQKKFHSLEQDAFNYLFGQKVVHLPIKYQYLILYDNFIKSFLMHFYKIKNKAELNEKNLSIIHYVTLNPWKYYNTPYVKLWDKYHHLSPFYRPLKRTFYHPIFNMYRKLRYNYHYICFRKNLFFNYYTQKEQDEV